MYKTRTIVLCSPFIWLFSPFCWGWINWIRGIGWPVWSLKHLNYFIKIRVNILHYFLQKLKSSSSKQVKMESVNLILWKILQMSVTKNKKLSKIDNEHDPLCFLSAFRGQICQHSKAVATFRFSKNSRWGQRLPNEWQWMWFSA